MTLKQVTWALLGSLLFGHAAFAVPCPAYSYTFASGNSAVAAQVNANFTSILTCANTFLAPLASPAFTGNVGIGTTSPASMLEVHGGNLRIYNTYPTIQWLENDGQPTDGSIWDNFAQGGVMNFRAVNDAYTAANTWLTVSRSGYTISKVVFPQGNVGIGVTSPTYTLQVNGTAGGTSGWVTISDARLKTKIVPVSNALGLIKQLRPVRYQWRSVKQRSVGKKLALPQNQTQIGFIAQELATVLPEAVVAPKAATDGTYGIKEADLIPILVEGMKEQQTEIEQLRAALAAMKSQKHATE